MSELIKVGVLDEQEIVHYGLRAYFSNLPDISLTGAYFRQGSALHAMARESIDILIIDHIFNRQGSSDFIQEVQFKYPKLRVLVFLAAPCTTTFTMLLDAGVHGIVFKRQPLEACVQAIRLLALGEHYHCPSMGIDPSVSVSTLTDISYAEAALLSLPSLSFREREVLRLCINGLTVTRIAERFSRSAKTVSTQKQAAYRKLGLKSDMDLFRRLAQYGV